MDKEIVEEDLSSGDPSVPSDLLDLHVQLEDVGMTPEDFQKEFLA